MITRRGLLRATLAAGAAGALPEALAAPGAAGPLLVIEDAGTAARGFGALLARRGAEVIVARGDPLAMLETLEARLAASPRPLCGLGREATRLLVAVTAGARGLRIAHAGLHDTAADGSTRHRCATPGAAPALEIADGDWPRALALHYDACLSGAPHAVAWQPRPGAAGAPAPGRLHSWLLLPAFAQPPALA